MYEDSSSTVVCFKGSISVSSSGKEKNEPSSVVISTFVSPLTTFSTSLSAGHKNLSLKPLHMDRITFFTGPKSTK